MCRSLAGYERRLTEVNRFAKELRRLPLSADGILGLIDAWRSRISRGVSISKGHAVALVNWDSHDGVAIRFPLIIVL
jgi:hypothetical protein